MRITRRQFISGLMAAGAVAAGVPLLGQAARGPAEGSTAATQLKQGKRVRQWAMVIDLRKCEGCVTIEQPPGCTEACITGHFVPDGQKWLEIFEEELPGGGIFFMPVPCQMCENAPCVQVCPVGASYHSEEGVVLINHDRCIGCRFCMAACPYSRRFFNWREPQLPPEAYFAEYSPEYPVPARRGTVIKCMFCLHNARQGKLPFCVQGCAMNALYFADLVEDVATNGLEVVKLSKFLAENNAYRFKEELGTRPRVWYIPGYGQELGRDPYDERKPIPNPTWEERRKNGNSPPHTR